MPHLFAACSLPNKNNLAEDTFVNGFHFTGTSSVEDMSTEIALRLHDFYGTPPTGSSQRLAQFMSSEINWPTARLKIYDWGDPSPRQPVYDEQLPVTPGTLVELLPQPAEVALCLSYAGEAVSGANPARRRGRIYIGPLNAGTLAPTPNQSARPAGAFMTVLARAGDDLATANTLGCQWVVWSTRGGSATEIVRGWVDDAFDTQRRRGVRPSARLTWEAGSG